MFYANSGYFRYDEIKQYYGSCDGTEVDEEALIREIREEQLSDGELHATIAQYFGQHSFDGAMYSCGSCGIREHSSTNVPHQEVLIEDLPVCFKYSDNDEACLNKLRKKA